MHDVQDHHRTTGFNAIHHRTGFGNRHAYEEDKQTEEQLLKKAVITRIVDYLPFSRAAIRREPLGHIMSSLVERALIFMWNKLAARRSRERIASGVEIGHVIRDGRPTRERYVLAERSRFEHAVIFGRTGVGKTSLLEHLMGQALRRNEGLLVTSHHGDIERFVLSTVAELERTTGKDLSTRLVPFNPADPLYCVGMNLIQADSEHQQFVLAAEISRILCNLYGLQSLGARTEELLRNTIIALAAAGFSFAYIQLFLTNAAFRAHCLEKVSNLDVREYFEHRYNTASDAMQGAMRDPILNKISPLVSDPAFRDALAQVNPAFSLKRALDEGLWVLLMLPKATLGEEAGTLAALMVSVLKNAIFARKSRKMFTCVFDEAQTLLAFDTGLDTMFSEARKFGCSIITAAQFLAQFPPHIRAALLSVGTHLCFQLSPQDAEQMATAFDGSRRLSERLKNLPKRQLIIKSGARGVAEVLVPEVRQPTASYTDLYERCRKRWGRLRTDISAEIAARRIEWQTPEKSEELRGWE